MSVILFPLEPMELEHGRLLHTVLQCPLPLVLKWNRQDLVSCLDSALCGTFNRLLSLRPVFLLHNEGDHSYLERLTEVMCPRHLAPSMCSPHLRP